MLVSTRKVLMFVLVVLLAACNRDRVRADDAETLPVDQLYRVSKDMLDSGQYRRASRFYERLVSRFPYGKYHEQAQLELAYSQHKERRAEDALSTVNRFIKLYPTHPRIDYAFYLRGLINFEREAGFLDRFIEKDFTRRDLANIRQSFQDFKELVEKYPQSGYANDARTRMVYLRNGLAQGEINIASYYYRRGAYVAAANRAKYVLEQFQDAPQAGDALALMALSYERLGQAKASGDARKVLELNYPQHPYFSGDFPKGRATWKQLNPFRSEA